MKSRLIGLSIVLSFVAVACTNGDRAAGPGASPGVTRGPGRTEAGVPGPLFPRAKSSKDVDRDAWTGEEVFITDSGFRPRTLFAVEDAKLLIINETRKTQVVRFVTGAWRSPPIPPGKSAAYTSDNQQSIILLLESDKNVKCHVQIGPYYEPGETATPSSSTR